MSFWQQLRGALRDRVGDFFRVPWPAVALLIGIIAAMTALALLRLRPGTGAQGARLCCWAS